MAIRVALTGGGTGGHAYPLVSVAREVKAIDPQAEFQWIGSKTGPEAEIARQADIAFTAVPAGKLRRYFSLKNIADMVKIPFGILKAWSVLGGFKPHVVFSKGGFVSYPTVVAAWLRDIPILLHETDSVPGMANRKLGKKATLIATSFPIIPLVLPRKKTIYTGNPIRLDLLQGSKERAMERFKLHNDKPILVIFGGSQGAVSINTAITEILPDLLAQFQVIHQVGPKNVADMEAVAAKYAGRGYHIAGFFTDELADVYAAADIIVSRAGGALHELAAIGKPVILLPLAGSASNHQVMNAFALQKQEAAVMIEEANLTAEILKSQILKLRHDPEARRRLAENIKKFAAPLAAKKIVYWLFRLAELG
jgi:UDP-N-acetylglucosamine--N-acetylmuramyl-(pentapeptide) pyrophosphoryl-undecaprenol N-acetylglucosamine transferase